MNFLFMTDLNCTYAGLSLLFFYPFLLVEQKLQTLPTYHKSIREKQKKSNRAFSPNVS